MGHHRIPAIRCYHHTACKQAAGSRGLEKVYTTYAIVAAVFAVIAFAFIRDYPEQAGAYPDNDKSYSKEEADKALADGLAIYEDIAVEAG